jgi:Rps23 Pro-64 3,4-dihydroxylase Tpa1-like proline 4-hydroxylase
MELFKNIDNKVFIIKNAIPTSLLNYLIERVEEGIRNKNAILRYNKREQDKQLFISMGDLSEEEFLDFKNENLFSKGQSKYYEVSMRIDDKELIDTYYQDILKDIFISNPNTYFHQNISDLFKYEPGNFMGLHADGGAGERLCTSVLYLNTMEEGFEGGEVIFYEGYKHRETPIETYRYKPEAGDFIIFASLDNEGIYHSVTSIKNWNRYAHRVYWKKEDDVKYSIK